MEIPEIPLTDPNAEPIKIEFPDADKFFENLKKSMGEYREKILECVREGKPIPKPYFRARRKDFTKVYECDEYKCDAHPRGCFFCKHSTDVWWDFTNGPYMIICELQKENDQDTPRFGCLHSHKQIRNYDRRVQERLRARTTRLARKADAHEMDGCIQHDR